MDASGIIRNTEPNKERFFQKHCFVSSFIISFIIFFIYFAVSGFNFVSGNDDYCIFKLINFGDIAIGCVGFFFTGFISLIQPLFGNLNFYSIALAIICFSSIWAINYVFLSKLKSKTGLFLTVIFDIIFLSFVVLEIFFSYTSIIASTAGFVLMVYGSQCEKRKRFRIVQIICGFLLLFSASQVRFQPSLSMGAVAAALVFGVLLTEFLKLKKENTVKSALKTLLRKYLKTGLLLIITAAFIVGMNAESSALKNNVKGYNELNEYNQAVSGVIDFNSASQTEYKDFYEKLDMPSGSDMAVLKQWFIDDEFFTIEKLNAISEFSDENVNGGIYNKGVASYVLFPIQNALSQSVESGLIIIYSLALLVVVFLFLFLWILLVKSRAVVLRIGILTLFWAFFIFVSDGFSLNNILTLPLIFITFYTAVKFNNRQFIITMILLLSMFSLYAYLSTLRLFFYTSLAAIFPAFVMIVFSLDNNNRTQQISSDKKSNILPVIVSVLLIISSVFTGAFIFQKQVFVEKNDSNAKLVEYVKKHPENVFAINQSCFFKDYFEPFVLPEEKHNVINYGLWVTKSGYIQNGYKENGIKHIFRDSIDSNLRIVLPEAKQDQTTIILHVADLEKFYNEHYAEDGKEIVMKKTGNAGRYALYKVVSQKAKQKTE